MGTLTDAAQTNQLMRIAQHLEHVTAELQTLNRQVAWLCQVLAARTANGQTSTTGTGSPQS